VSDMTTSFSGSGFWWRSECTVRDHGLCASRWCLRNEYCGL